MTEWDKAKRGDLYNSYDKDILIKRQACADLCYKYNLLLPSDIKSKNELLKKLLGEIKGNIEITAPFYCDYGFNIKVGSNFYTNYNCTILDAAQVTFGDNVLIGPNCTFTTATHPIDYQTRNKGLEIALPIKVGSNVWFGAGVIVLPGITIGDNVVIGAGSVITKDIPSNVVAVGNPCHIIKNI